MLFIFQHRMAYAAETEGIKKVKAGVFLSPPFVMLNQGDGYYGIAVDLWEAVSGTLRLETEYVEYNSLETLMEGLIAGEIDFIVTNLTVKYERARSMKFSYPWYDGGLRIMVKNDREDTLWHELKTNGQLHAYLWILLFILILSFLLTVFCRRKDPDYPKKWRDGLALSLYNLVIAVKTGVIEGKLFGWMGHLLAVIWMFSGIALVAYITSSVTSSMTKMTLTSEINSLSELSGKVIGVETGGVEEQYLRALGFSTIAYDNIIDACEGLYDDKVNAVIGDAPVLEYLSCINKEKTVKVVGELFYPDKYAFATNKKHTDLMDRISIELIKIHDNGDIDNLKNRYTGMVK